MTTHSIMITHIYYVICIMRTHTHVYYEGVKSGNFFVSYKTIKRELKKRIIYECRCDTRLKDKTLLCLFKRFVYYYESMK
jgi:hypothetical protein